MRRGVHQLRGGFNSLIHDGLTPLHYNLDNGNYRENMRIDSVEIMPTSVDSVTNNRSISGVSVFFVISTTEPGAIPHSASSSHARPYGLRITDSDCIGWGFIEANQPPVVILDPFNLISEDLYVNAWSVDSAKSPVGNIEDIGFLITMTQDKQSGDEGLLAAVREASSSRT